MKDKTPENSLIRPRIGIALGSGVARGWTHIGILRAMQQKGIEPDIIVGTSIGAVVGGAYVSGGLDALEKWARDLSRTNFFRFLNLKFLGGGLFGGKKLVNLMETHFGTGNIEDLPKPFVALASELQTGHEVWLRKGPLIQAIQASFALPGVFDPVEVNGRWLVDGALTNPVPVNVCRALGAELVIAVNLSEDIYGRARAEREGALGTGKYGVFSDALIRQTDPSEAHGIGKTVIRKMLHHDRGAPSLFANMVASLNVVQNRLSRSRLAGDPPDITLIPRCGHVGLMEFHRASELIDIGHKTFEAEWDNIKDAFSIISYRMNA